MLERLPLLSCSDDFVFDNQMVVQAVFFGFRIGEISCPTKYFEEASSINFQRSVTYGFGVLGTAMSLRLKRWGLAKPRSSQMYLIERLRSREHGGRIRSRLASADRSTCLGAHRLQASNTISKAPMDAIRWLRAWSIPDRVQYAIYALALAGSISIWFIAIRAPLWLDETVSIYLIQGGFAGIMSRQVWPDAPTYSCLLWLWTKMVGMGEIALRISSILPMLGAVYVLYRAARELFGREVGLIAAIVFCLHPIIIFASIDIRPYAFAALAINSSILALVHLRHNESNWLAALFGLSAACIVQFQLLFAVILPALAICFVVLKIGDRKTLWRQLGVAFVAFTFAFLPVIPRLQYMVHTSGTHVFSPAPTLLELGSTLTIKRAGGDPCRCRSCCGGNPETQSAQPS